MCPVHWVNLQTFSAFFYVECIITSGALFVLCCVRKKFDTKTNDIVFLTMTLVVSAFAVSHVSNS